MSGIIGNMQSECVRSRSYESINTKARMETTFGTSAFSPVTTITRVENEHDGSLNRNSASMTCVASSNSTSLGRDGDINGVVGSDQGSFDAVCFKRHHRTSSTISARSHHSISSCTEDDEEAVVLFVEEPSSKLFCILCQRVFKDPVITSCGHTFCRTCVLSRSCEKCPVDDNKLSIVVVNLAVSEQIGELYIHCKYGCKLSSTGSLTDYEVNPSGCPVTFKFSNRHEHERNCQYAPTQCPNSLHCPTLLKMDLEDHLQVCEHMKCPHQKYGCHMEGNHKEVRLHLETCKFEAVKEFLQHTDKRMEELKTMLKDKDQEIVFLKAMILKLTERVDRMEKTVDIRIDLLDESQTKLSSDLLDSRQSVSQIQTDLANVEARLWGVGTFDIQPLFKCKGTFVGHQGPVWTLCTHGEWLFSGSSDKTIKVWDTLTTYKCVKTLEGHSSIVLALCTHEKKLYSGSADCTINVWCLEELELLDSIRGHENPVCTLVTKRKMLFSGSLKKIKVWNLQTMELIQELTGLNHWVRALVASERHLFSGSYQTIKLWDLDSLECVRVLQTSGGSVYSLAVTKEYIVCGTYENQIQVYDVNTHKHLETLNGHVGTVYGLAVLSAPGQTRLFSASYDRSLRVWNLESFTCVQTLLRHQGSVAALAVTKGRIFSGAVDSTVKVWQ